MDIFRAILAGILIVGGIVYLFACLLAFTGHVRKIKRSHDYLPTVSVIIAARNEEKNIGVILDDLLDQDYPGEKLSIVVVDDSSQDRTKHIVQDRMSRNDRILLRETRFSRSPYSHKKKAVHEGVLSSDGEIIVTVDADCRVERHWISNLVSCFIPGVDLVAGEVFVEGRGLFQKLEILEFTGIQTMASGLMNAHFPITCNGANLAYRRSAFERVGGFSDVGSMVSGDDDLLMQKIADGNPASVIFADGRDTAVHVKAHTSLLGFLGQRSRWASKILAYPSRGARVLMGAFFVYFCVILVWFAGAAAGLLHCGVLAAGYGMKITGDALLCGCGALKRGDPGLLVLLPLAELVHVPYIVSVTLRGAFGSFDWRGRRTGAIGIERGNIGHD